MQYQSSVMLPLKSVFALWIEFDLKKELDSIL